MKSGRRSIAILAVALAAGCAVCGCAGEKMDEARRPPESRKSDPDRPPERPVQPPDEAGPPPETAIEPSEHVAGPPQPKPLEPQPEPPAPKPTIARPYGTKSVAPPVGLTRKPKVIGPDFVIRSSGSGGATSAPLPAERLPETRPETGDPPATEPAARTAEAPPADPEAAEPPDVGFTRVKVYYGTDRARNEAGGPSPLAGFPWHLWLMVSAGITIALASVALFRPKSRLLKGLAGAGLLATLLLGISTAWSRVGSDSGELAPDEFYGNQRGGVELGTCEVSIPERHELGELEGPSILRLDFHENPERHVVLLQVTPQSPDEFFADCRRRVADSKSGEALVFVHGYNVSFEDAARRTAQLAYDLQFDGAPFFYSWPSQAGLLKYSIDETNVVWTVPHLKEFLVEVVRKSGARSVHLIAHSMGNRALTSALYNLSYELGGNAKVFRQVILTAPDIDADVFRRDIAPAIVKTADRVTLYASSKDEALTLSKKVHGYPRAGDSGSDLVVVPGIDTIDVSAADTSLLGHSYYGSNDTVLADLAQLLLEAKPPDQRPWLRSAEAGPLRYWVLLRDQVGAGPRPGLLR